MDRVRPGRQRSGRPWPFVADRPGGRRLRRGNVWGVGHAPAWHAGRAGGKGPARGFARQIGRAPECLFRGRGDYTRPELAWGNGCRTVRWSRIGRSRNGSARCAGWCRSCGPIGAWRAGADGADPDGGDQPDPALGGAPGGRRVQHRARQLLDQYFGAALAIAALLAVGTGLRYYLVTRLGERVVADIRRACSTGCSACRPPSSNAS
jgi:hypothetical protein